MSKVMSIIIRNAIEDDIDYMCEMLAGIFLIETDFKKDTTIQRRALTLLLRDKDNKTALVAENDSMTAGMITGQLVVSSAVGGYSILLEDLFVIPEYRTRGIASMLIRHLISWGKTKGAVRVQLVADNRNPAAMKLYKNAGFLSSNMRGLYKMI
jgi:GNAT superfamily N-acetyltransferase